MRPIFHRWQWRGTTAHVKLLLRVKGLLEESNLTLRLSNHPSSSAISGSGCVGSSFSWEAQISFYTATSSSSSEEIPRHSQASRHTRGLFPVGRAWNTWPGRHPGGSLIRCLRQLIWRARLDSGSWFFARDTQFVTIGESNFLKFPKGCCGTVLADIPLQHPVDIRDSGSHRWGGGTPFEERGLEGIFQMQEDETPQALR